MDDRKLIITIGREYGSGGAAIGAALAKSLGIPCYDKNILSINSRSSSIQEDLFHLADEKAGNKLLQRIISSLTPDSRQLSFGSDRVSAGNLFRFQSEVIKKLALEESCIFIGRCADYVLADTPGLVRIHLFAPEKYRICQVRQRNIYAEDEVPRAVRRIDRERREYYRYYTGHEWGAAANYDLLFDTSKTDIDGAIALIRSYLTITGHSLPKLD